MSESPLFQDIENRTLFVADNLEVMRKMEDEVVDLIYLDPPFGTMDTWKAKNKKKILETKNYFKKLQSENGLFLKEDFDAMFKDVKFKDLWKETDVNRSWQEELMKRDEKLFRFIDEIDFAKKKEGGKFYLFYMAIRLLEMKRILKETGSLYLHCDYQMGHYLKGVLDLTFGYENFRNEVVWHYQTGGVPKKDFSRKHDTIFRYSKTEEYFFYPNEILDKRTPEVLRRLATGNESATRSKGTERHPVDVFIIPHINSMASERTGYATQKPLALLERIIKASSKKGDVVLDPFCGCATTCIAAESLGRRWIGIDKNRVAFFMNYYRMRTRSMEQIKSAKRRTEKTLFDEVITTTEFDETALPQMLMRYLKTPRETLPRLSDREKDQAQDRKIAVDKVLDARYQAELQEKAALLSSAGKKALREKLRKQQCNRCKICQRELTDSCHFDRIIPGKAGGRYEEKNMQVLCVRCNITKNANSNIWLVEKLFDTEKLNGELFALNIHREFNEGRIGLADKERLLEKAKKAVEGKDG